MATPQITGTTALLLQVDPSLTPDKLRKILLDSTKAVDANGQPISTRAWNANYGLGKVSIFDAVQLAKRVRLRRFQKGSSALSALVSFFGEPADADADAILREEAVLTADLISYPATFDGTAWLTPEQIWGR